MAPSAEIDETGRSNSARLTSNPPRPRPYLPIPRRHPGLALWALAPLAGFALATTACNCGDKRGDRYEPVPLSHAAAIVNRNIAKIETTLRAVGPVDGKYLLEDGTQRSYHVEAVLFYLAPNYLRFDLKKFGARHFLLGSNKEHFWIYSAPEDEYFCGTRGEDEEVPEGLPARLSQLPDALGLTMIPLEGGAPRHQPIVQRVVDDFQQLLFLVRDEDGAIVLEKEYWLDRYPPRLIRRVIFRDPGGVVEMRSELDDYRPLAPDGPMLPYLVTVEWPKDGTSVRFDVSKWSFEPRVSASGVQFRAPRACLDP